MKSAATRFRASKPWRAWERYTRARGNVLAGGVSYFAFFSIFPAVALAFTVFGIVLRGHPELLASVTANLHASLPGFLQDPQHPDGLIPIKVPRPATLTITAVIAFISLVLAGIGWLGAVREGVRAVFGAEMALGHLVSTKLRDFGVLCALGVGVLFSAALTTMAGGTAGWIAERIGLSGQSWLLVLAGVPVSVLTDTALMLLLMGVVSGVHASWRDLLHGALVGGVGFSLLKLCADALLLRLTANPLFASIAVVIGLLIWLNLIARLTLLSAAWAANDVDERHAEERSPAEQADPSVAVPRNASSVAGTAAGAPRTAAARRPVLPTFGPRSADRATLAAGAVLGAAAVAATGTMFRSIRSLVGLGRR